MSTIKRIFSNPIVFGVFGVASSGALTTMVALAG